jgi:hypothetical protein
MRVCDAVAVTRASGSARFEVTTRLGGPSLEQEDLRGSGVVDFQADRVLIAEQLVTPRIRKQGNQGFISRAINRPLLAIMNWIVGRDAFYEGGARWVFRRGRWRGPKGSIHSAKNTWHPLFLLDMIDADERPLTGGRSELFSGVDVCRYELQIDGDEVSPAVREQWRLGQRDRRGGEEGQLSRYPRSVLYVGDAGLLHGFAYESGLDDDDEASVWKSVWLMDFGTSSAEVSRIRDQIEA